MRSRNTLQFTAAVLAVVALAWVGDWSTGVAHADISKAVQKKLKGSIIVTADGELATTFDSDAAMLSAYKKANLKVVKGTANEEGTKSWTFFVMAFMKSKPGVREVSLDFYRVEGKKKVYAANKRLSGLDPTLPLLSTRIDLSEDDGLNAGRTYVVKLTAKRGKRETTLAETTLTTK